MSAKRMIIRSGVIALALCIGAAPASKPTTTATTRAAITSPSISAAIAALLQECDSSSPRSKPDYFVAHPPAPSVESITAALSRTLAGNPSRDAYAKWQLLGALPEKAEGKLVDQLLDAYRQPPALQVRPGLETREKQQLDSVVQRAKQEQSAELQDALTSGVERIAKSNSASLAYRADLYRRLPMTFDSLASGFQDAKQRCAAGIDPKPFIKQLSSDLKAWAADATGQQLAAMSHFLTDLSQTSPTEYYDAVEWTTTGGFGHLRWKKKKLNLNERKQLDDLVDFVRKQQRSAEETRKDTKEVSK